MHLSDFVELLYHIAGAAHHVVKLYDFFRRKRE